MPNYEYECLKCGSRFEEIRKFSDAPLTKHDGCGGRVKKLFSAPAIQFKGSGWYITDYARKGKDAAAKKADSESKPEAKTESKTDSKAESKAEAKTESKADSKTESKSKDTTTKN